VTRGRGYRHYCNCKIFQQQCCTNTGGNDYFRSRRHCVDYFQTLLVADKKDSDYSMEWKATYVFKRNSHGEWLCAIDNSYSTDLITK